jgi:hypothetical protein
MLPIPKVEVINAESVEQKPIRQRGTSIPKDQKDSAHAHIEHGPKSIIFGLFRRFLVFFIQNDSLRLCYRKKLWFKFNQILKSTKYFFWYYIY